jgi:hypothetical protein
VPVSRVHAEARWFGVPPPLVLLGLTLGSFLASLGLLAEESWAIGAILLGLSALLMSAFLEVARRRPDSALTRASANAADGAWSRAKTSVELLRARSRAVADTQLERAERAVIESDRRAVRLRLAEAVLAHDEAEAGALRERLRELDRAEETLREVLEGRLARTDERVRRLRLSAAETMVVSPDEGDSRRPAA